MYMKLIFSFIATVILVSGLNSHAQSINRMVIGTTGSVLMEKGYYLNQTVGEAFSSKL